MLYLTKIIHSFLVVVDWFPEIKKITINNNRKRYGTWLKCTVCFFFFWLTSFAFVRSFVVAAVVCFVVVFTYTDKNLEKLVCVCACVCVCEREREGWYNHAAALRRSFAAATWQQVIHIVFFFCSFRRSFLNNQIGQIHHLSPVTCQASSDTLWGQFRSLCMSLAFGVFCCFVLFFVFRLVSFLDFFINSIFGIWIAR